MKVRRFGVGDAMVLVAAVTIALGMGREGCRDLKSVPASSLVVPPLATLTVAVLVMRLRRPRPPLRKLVRLQGTAACLMALSSAIFLPLVDASRDRTPLIVAGAWAWLGLKETGFWRPEPTWIDRLGRALGWAWIIVPLAVWTMPPLR
jgi:hypothetical protein